MPFPVAAALTAASTLGTAGANIAFQGSMNRKTREFSEQMYNRQYQDNLAQWHMQNEYNSPQAQMSRLKEAGLNPNLVYGSGNAIQPAAPPKSADAPSWSPSAPRINLDASSPINTHFDAQIKGAQVDNLKAQNSVLVNEALLKMAQIANLTIGTKKTGLETDLLDRSMGNTLAMQAENLRKLSYDTELSRAGSMTAEANAINQSETIRLTAEKVLNELNLQKADLTGKNLDNFQKSMTNQLLKNGINPNDPMYMRIIGRVLSNYLNLSNLKF